MEVYIWKLSCIDRRCLKSGDSVRSLRDWSTGEVTLAWSREVEVEGRGEKRLNSNQS